MASGSWCGRKNSRPPVPGCCRSDRRGDVLMGQFGIGQGIKRVEDVRLLRGGGRYLDDVNVPGQTYAVIVRSPHAHARLRDFDISAAQRAPGVIAVFTAADLAKDGLGTMVMTLKRKRPDGSPMFARPHLGLTQDRVRYVGDPIALVVAETRAQAEDAADLVQVDYEPLPSVTSTAEAPQPGSAAVWDECPDNISNVFESGDKVATEAAFARAHRVVRRRYIITRVHAQYMEPRGSLGVYDPNEDRYTLYADVQYPHRVRNALASNVFKVPEHRIRVVAGDVGGGFGTKGWQYPEHRLVLWAARKLRRPVKWTCERREAILADEHARDNVSDAELALDADGRFLAMRVHTLANVGAYISSDRNLLATFSNVVTLVGVYAFPTAYVHVTSVMTNTNSTPPASSGWIGWSFAARISSPPRRCHTRTRWGPRTIAATSRRAWRRRSSSVTSPASRPGATRRGDVAGCAGWPSSTRSSRRPAPSRSSRRSASRRAGAPRFSWARRTRARGTRRPSSRFSTSGS